MKLWSLNKYWVAFGVVSFLSNLVSLAFGVNVLLSLFVLGVFGFGCILAVASLYKLVNKTVNPSAVQPQLAELVNKTVNPSAVQPQLAELVNKTVNRKNLIYMTSKDIEQWLATQTSGR